MKLLITGASGLLGLNLCLKKGATHSIFGLDRGKLRGTPFELVHADLTAPEAASRLLQQIRPDAVIHTAALANLEACEADPQSARLLNAEVPGLLAQSAARAGIRFLHISTDAVFDGTKDGIYTELDQPSPPGVYSATKLQGEVNVLSTNPTAIVARVNFFGWSLSGTRSLSEFFYNKLSTGQPANGFTDVSFCPLFVGDLAEILLHMLEKNLAGLYHVVAEITLTV